MNYCECGCGQPIIEKPYRRFYPPQRYVSGHNQRGVGTGTAYNQGYVRYTRGNNIWRYEHNVIMEEHLKRKIRGCEIVHHINGNKKDNRLVNLKLMTKSQHMKLHDINKPRDNRGRFIKT